MSKKMVVMLLPVERGPKMRVTTKSLLKFIDRIPCDVQHLKKPSAVNEFIRNQMEDYPFTKRSTSEPKRVAFLKQRINESLSSPKIEKLNRLTLRLQKKVTFLELEQLSELMSLLTKKQIKQYSKNLQIIGNRLSYYLRASLITEDYIFKQATEMVNRIILMTQKKSNQIC